MKRTIILQFEVDTPLTYQEMTKLKENISETLYDMEFHVSSKEIKTFEER